MGTVLARPPGGDGEAALTSPLLRALPHADLAATIKRSRGVTRRCGDRIGSAHDDAVTIILEGVAACGAQVDGGEHVIQALHGRGSTIGLPTALGHKQAAGDLISIGTVRALVVPADTVRDLVDRCPAATRACLTIVAAQHAALCADQVHLASSASGERVEHRLVELAERFGRQDGQRVRVEVPLTQEMLASWARTSRESTVRALQALRRADLISTGRRYLVIEDLDRLRARRRARADPTIAELLRVVD
jgi:CRP/FNR family transcriptional regulator, cyclic AMP receptor protein